MVSSWDRAIQFRADGDIIAMGKHNLGDVGAEKWANWARARAKGTTSRRITKLCTADFSGNNLSDRGVRAIVAILRELHPETRILKLFRNNLSRGGEVTPLLQLGQLTELHLSHNNLNAEEITNIIREIKNAGYPQNDRAPLWLRLEHNVPDEDARLAENLRSLREDICVVNGKTACNPFKCRRGGGSRKAAIHLLYVDLEIRRLQPTEQIGGQRSVVSTVGKQDWKPDPQQYSCKPLKGWAQPAEKEENVEKKVQHGFSWSVEDFPALAGSTSPQLSPVGSSLAKSATEVRSTYAGAPPKASAAGQEQELADKGFGTEYHPREQMLAPSSAIPTPTRFRATATYHCERGGFLSLQEDAGGVIVHGDPAGGDVQDNWPWYVYAQNADGTMRGWFPLALCHIFSDVSHRGFGVMYF